MARDPNVPNKAANKEKAEGDRWTSDDNTVERRDREATGRMNEPEHAGGITNRPLDDEEANLEAVPERGESVEGAHAGHGRRPKESR